MRAETQHLSHNKLSKKMLAKLAVLWYTKQAHWQLSCCVGGCLARAGDGELLALFPPLCVLVTKRTAYLHYIIF